MFYFVFPRAGNHGDSWIDGDRRGREMRVNMYLVREE